MSLHTVCIFPFSTHTGHHVTSPHIETPHRHGRESAAASTGSFRNLGEICSPNRASWCAGDFPRSRQPKDLSETAPVVTEPGDPCNQSTCESSSAATFVILGRVEHGTTTKSVCSEIILDFYKKNVPQKLAYLFFYSCHAMHFRLSVCRSGNRTKYKHTQNILGQQNEFADLPRAWINTPGLLLFGICMLSLKGN